MNTDSMPCRVQRLRVQLQGVFLDNGPKPTELPPSLASYSLWRSPSLAWEHKPRSRQSTAEEQQARCLANSGKGNKHRPGDEEVPDWGSNSPASLVGERMGSGFVLRRRE